MAASIYDVAERAGVSISTVSRILNSSANVSEKKKVAVLEAMKDLDFEPNQFGRGLVKQTTNLIGVYFPMTATSLFDNEYNLELLRGIEEVLTDRKYGMVLIAEDKKYNENRNITPRYLEYIKQRKIDGLVMSGLSDKNIKDTAFEQIINENYPAVYIGKKVHKKGLNVYAQLEEYSIEMIQQLVEYGHRKIIFLCPMIHKHYEDAIRRTVSSNYSDISLEILSLSGITGMKEEIRDILEHYILGKQYTAVCAPGMEASSLFTAVCQEMGIRFPEQVSLLSVEHRQGNGDLIYPGISSYFVPTREMGRGAARLLLDNIQGRVCESASIEYKTEYIERDSIRRI